MTTRVRSFVLTIVAFTIGFFASWTLNHRPSTGSTMLTQTCTERAKEVSDKCHEAERRRAIFEKKYPESSESRDAKKTDAALRSPEWERSASWAQACDDAKAQLEESILDTTGNP